MNEFLWLVGRGTGIAALVFLTVSVSLGILTARRWGSRETPRFAVAEIHRRASLGASLLLIVHVVTLVLDSRSGLGWLDVLVPFVSAGSALWYGLGTLAFELIAVLVVTSLLRKHLPYAVWRGLHWLSYLSWPVALAHGIGAGSDAGAVWMLLVSGACLVLVMWSVATRLLGTAPTLQPARRRGEDGLRRDESALPRGESVRSRTEAGMS